MKKILLLTFLLLSILAFADPFTVVEEKTVTGKGTGFYKGISTSSKLDLAAINTEILYICKSYDYTKGPHNISEIFSDEYSNEEIDIKFTGSKNKKNAIVRGDMIDKKSLILNRKMDEAKWLKVLELFKENDEVTVTATSKGKIKLSFVINTINFADVLYYLHNNGKSLNDYFI